MSTTPTVVQPIGLTSYYKQVARALTSVGLNVQHFGAYLVNGVPRVCFVLPNTGRGPRSVRSCNLVMLISTPTGWEIEGYNNRVIPPQLLVGSIPIASNDAPPHLVAAAAKLAISD